MSAKLWFPVADISMCEIANASSTSMTCAASILALLNKTMSAASSGTPLIDAVVVLNQLPGSDQLLLPTAAPVHSKVLGREWTEVSCLQQLICLELGDLLDEPRLHRIAEQSIRRYLAEVDWQEVPDRSDRWALVAPVAYLYEKAGEAELLEFIRLHSLTGSSIQFKQVLPRAGVEFLPGGAAVEVARRRRKLAADDASCEVAVEAAKFDAVESATRNGFKLLRVQQPQRQPAEQRADDRRGVAGGAHPGVGPVQVHGPHALLVLPARQRLGQSLIDANDPVAARRQTEGPVEYRQCAFVAPLEEHEPQSQQWCGDCPSVGVVEYTVESTGGGEAQASLELLFESRSQDPPPGLSKPRVPKYAAGADGTFWLEGEKVFVIVNASGCDALQFDYRDGVLALSGTLAAGERAALRVFVYEKSTPATHVSDGPDRARELRLATARYWTSALSSAWTIRTPEELVNNILRSSLVRILIAARNEEGGRRVASWIAAFAYGALENESQTIIQCMTRFGFTGFARRALDYFRHRYNDQGLLSTGYTMMGKPWNLWAIAEHYDATGDRQWLTAMAPLMRSACAWIVRQRRKTMAMDARGEKVPEYGLVPPGVTGDWSRFGYRFYAQAIYHAGLANAAHVLQEIGDPAGAALVEEAKAFRADIVRAYRIAQSRHPVLPLPNQAWVRPYPCMIYGRGRAGLLFPSGNRGSTYTYDTDHGALHLAALGVLDPVSPDVDEMLDEIEEIAYLDPCFHNALYSVERNHKLWFDCGGFSKHYVGLSRIGDVYAQRDEPQLFIRSLFNRIPAALDCENLTFWEPGIGAAWDKTHYAAAILLNFRSMFVQERGEELWLAPFVPTHCLADGNEIYVRNALTAFGAVSHRLHSHAQAGFIDARIDPPKRRQPTTLVLRARHPGAKPIASVSVNDKPHRDFDADQGTVRLPLGTEPLQLRIIY